MSEVLYNELNYRRKNSSLVLANKHGQEKYRKITRIKYIKIKALGIVTHNSKSQYNCFTRNILCAIVGFCREVNENCALLCYHAASSDNSLPMFRDITTTWCVITRQSAVLISDRLGDTQCISMKNKAVHYLVNTNIFVVCGRSWSL
jgi:hypothetical protein